MATRPPDRLRPRYGAFDGDFCRVTADRIAVALRYAAEFPEEIEARIELPERDSAHYESLAAR